VLITLKAANLGYNLKLKTMINSIPPLQISKELEYWIDKKRSLDLDTPKEEIIAFYGAQGMLSTDKAKYKMLQRKCGEKYRKLFDQGTYGRIKSKSPNAFNNQLVKMQEFLKSIPYGDFSNNRWLKIHPII